MPQGLARLPKIPGVKTKYKSWRMREPFRSVSGHPLFDELAALAECASFSRGEALFREGERSDTLWLIQSGWVRLRRRVIQAQELTLDLVTPRKKMCGLSAFFGGSYMTTAVAVVPVEAVGLSGAILKPLVHSDADFANHVAYLLNLRYRHIAAAYSLAFAPVEQRIASVLIRLYEDFGKRIPLTRREISELAGTTVETSIRTTNRMRGEGLISADRGVLTILKLNKLREKLEQ